MILLEEKRALRSFFSFIFNLTSLPSIEAANKFVESLEFHSLEIIVPYHKPKQTNTVQSEECRIRLRISVAIPLEWNGIEWDDCQ